MKKMNAKDFLKELLHCASPAGKEDEARFLLNRFLSPCADRFYTDVLGNSYAVLNEKAKYKIMITGHQDEIAAQIIRIDDRGYLYFRNSGFPFYHRWAGGKVEVITHDGRHVPGVIINQPTKPLSDETFNVKNMFVDIGVDSREEAEKLVSIGDYIVTAPNYQILNGTRLVSKALDDKIGVYICAEAFRRIAESGKLPKDIGLYFVGAVQEELGSRGAKTAAYAIQPNVAFAVDVSNVSDSPGADAKELPEFGLGKGIGIYRNANNTPALLDRMLDIAKKKKIQVQFTPHYLAVSWTDASVLQVNQGGCATALLGVPNRYMHAQTEMSDLNDAEAGVRLLVETILAINSKDTFLPPVE